MKVSGHGGSRVRVRLAPSPTGFVHIGNVLVALVDAAIARKFDGAFVIRIEDTDQKRFLEGAEQLIYDWASGLWWLHRTVGDPLENAGHRPHNVY